MITNDKSIFDAKVAEVSKSSEFNNYICLDEADFELASRDATGCVLIELESTTGVDNLLKQMTSALDTLRCAGICEMIMHILTYSMTMSDIEKIDETVSRYSQTIRSFKRGLSFDDGLKNGHHKLTLFLYIKDDNQ